MSDSQKMADFCGFLEVRTLRSSAFGVDNGSRERHALAAFRLTPERAIGLARADRAVTRRSADILFTNGVTDADDHQTLSLSRNS